MNPMVGVVHWTTWMMARIIKIRPFNEAMLKRGSRNENGKNEFCPTTIYYTALLLLRSPIDWTDWIMEYDVCIWSLECWSWVKSGHGRDFLINLCAYPKQGWQHISMVFHSMHRGVIYQFPFVGYTIATVVTEDRKLAKLISVQRVLNEICTYIRSDTMKTN